MYQIQSFDHAAVAEQSQAYEDASRALDNLAHAVAGQFTRDEWIKFIQEIALALPYADMCDGCWHIFAPYRAEINEREYMLAHHLCQTCRRIWTCTMSVYLPELF